MASLRFAERRVRPRRVGDFRVRNDVDLINDVKAQASVRNAEQHVAVSIMNAIWCITPGRVGRVVVFFFSAVLLFCSLLLIHESCDNLFDEALVFF